MAKAVTALCKSCRWWAFNDRYTPPDEAEAVCERIHCGGGARLASARIFPVQTGAYLQTKGEFGCALYEEKGSRS